MEGQLHWNAAHNDECSYHTEKRHEPTPMGLRNTGWMWSHGEREIHDSVNTVSHTQKFIEICHISLHRPATILFDHSCFYEQVCVG